MNPSRPQANGVGRSLLGFWQLVGNHAVYLWLAVALPLAAAFLTYLVAPTWQLKGQSVSIVLWLGGTALVIGLWIPFRGSIRWSWPAQATLALLILAWGLQLWRMRSEGVGFNYSTFSVPILLALILAKPPSMPDVLTAVRVFSFGALAVAVGSIAADLAGLAPSGFVAGRNGYSRLPILSDLLGIDTRWDGAFQHSNYAGMIGGAVILLSLTLGPKERWVLVPGGAIILMLSQSRTGALAAIVGLAVWGLILPSTRGPRHHKALRWFSVGVLVLGITLYIGIVDPTLGTRTSAWQQFWLLWTSSPLMGVGTLGVEEYFRQATNAEVLAFTHAHNLLLDQAARYGVVLALLTVGALVTTGTAVMKAARVGTSATAALFAFIVMCALVEVPFSLTYISALSVPLLLTVLLAGATTPELPRPPSSASMGLDSPPLR